jgi:glycosyltransferase involved in cell wall biosynthesis
MWELLIIDDGSTDAIEEVLSKFSDSRVKYIRTERNFGVSKARNLGLSMAKGSFFAYLDSDNTMLPQFLEGIVRSFELYPQALCGFTAQEVVWMKGKDAEKSVIRFGPFHRALLENRNYIDLGCFVHKRRLYERLGGFDESMQRLVDWELILRFTEEQPAVPFPILGGRYFHGAVEDQITSTECMSANDLKVRARAMGEPLKVSARAVDLGEGIRVTDQGSIFVGDNCLNGLPARLCRSGKNRQVAVIIPSFQVAEFVRIAIDSVKRYSPDQTKIVVVDNASDAPVRDMLREIGGITVIQNEKNMGFTYAANQGLHETGMEDVVLFNNDAVATPGWIQAFWDVLDHHEGVGRVRPRHDVLSRSIL